MEEILDYTAEHFFLIEEEYELLEDLNQLDQ